MTTEQKIAAIIKERYNNYEGVFYSPFKEIHQKMREKDGDGAFLRYLEGNQKVNSKKKP